MEAEVAKAGPTTAAEAAAAMQSGSGFAAFGGGIREAGLSQH